MSDAARGRGMIRRVVTATVPEPSAPYSNCLVIGGTVYISGQHAGGPDGRTEAADAADQARIALRRCLALVEAAGGTADDVVKVVTYLTDIATRPAVSAVRREFFAEPYPCSTLVGISALAFPGLLVEIDLTAVIGAGPRA